VFLTVDKTTGPEDSDGGIGGIREAFISGTQPGANSFNR
jgi:hypothetical protein